MSSWIAHAIGVLKEWQTLAVGLIALSAAWWAARPVYRQLRDAETQSNATLREVLAPRVADLERHKDQALAPGRAAAANLVRDLGDLDEESLAGLGEEAAFHHWQVVRSTADLFTKFRSRRFDVVQIEQLKEPVSVALGHLEDLLNEVHTPASMPQEGEGYAITDQEWEVIKQRGQAARYELPDALAELSDASEALEKAYDDEAARLRRRIVELDRALLR